MTMATTTIPNEPTSNDKPTNNDDGEDAAGQSDDATTNINWKERVDPELLPVLARFPSNITFASKWKVRAFSALMHIPGPTAAGVKSTKIKGIGKLCFPVDKAGAPITNPSRHSNSTAAAVLWMHGGGRIMGSASGAGESIVCSRIVHCLQVPVLSAAYRLAPANPFPAALDDLVVAYKWLARRLKSHAKEGGDVRIVVAGESAGGGLAAELCQRLLDESKKGDTSDAVPFPVAQLLLYPMLDDRTCVNEAKTQCPPHFVWNNTSNMYGWSSYLGSGIKPGDTTLPKYAAAARREDLSGLPPAWIMVGDLDLFRDECEEYAKRLESHGVETRYVEVKGGFHGIFSMGKSEKPILKVWKDFEEFGRRQLFGDDGNEDDTSDAKQ